jgi:hypothetical protein
MPSLLMQEYKEVNPAPFPTNVAGIAFHMEKGLSEEDSLLKAHLRCPILRDACPLLSEAESNASPLVPQHDMLIVNNEITTTTTIIEHLIISKYFTSITFSVLATTSFWEALFISIFR